VNRPGTSDNRRISVEELQASAFPDVVLDSVTPVTLDARKNRTLSPRRGEGVIGGHIRFNCSCGFMERGIRHGRRGGFVGPCRTARDSVIADTHGRTDTGISRRRTSGRLA